MRARLVAAVLLAAAVSACGLGQRRCEAALDGGCCEDGGCAAPGPTDAGAGDAGAPEPQGPSDVTGLVEASRSYDPDAGTHRQDLSLYQVAALVPNDAGYTSISGSAFADGSFTIPQVPAGPFLLQLANVYLETSSHDLHFTWPLLGRANGTLASVNPTWLELRVNALQAWTPMDSLGLYCPNAGLSLDSIASYSSQMPATGATSADTYFDTYYASLYQGVPLLDADQGDVVWVTQTSSVSTSIDELSIVSAATLAPFTQSDGATAVATATMGAPRQESATLVLDQASMGAAASTLGSYPFFVAQIAAAPTPEARYSSEWFAQLSYTWSSASLPFPSPIVSGNPFPSSWDRLVALGGFQSEPRALAGAAPLNFSNSYMTYDRLVQVAGKPFTAQLTVVRNLTVEGQDALSDQSGFGVTPRFEWQPPETAKGPNLHYRLWLEKLAASRGATTVTTYQVFITTKTSLRIPRGLLAAGQPFVVIVEARTSSEPVTGMLQDSKLPQSTSYLTSGILRP